MNNLENIFNQALPVEIENGLKWYSDAHNILEDLAVKYNIKVNWRDYQTKLPF